MQLYEYLCRYVSVPIATAGLHESALGLERVVNAYAEKGWRLVSVVALSDKDPYELTKGYVITMERPKQQQ
jgi:hypothetical protein